MNWILGIDIAVFVIWAALGICNIIVRKSINKLDYFLVWLMAMLALIQNVINRL